jgi:hypothetical protein
LVGGNGWAVAGWLDRFLGLGGLFDVLQEMIETFNIFVQLGLIEVSCRIFEHFVTSLDPATEFIKVGSTLHRQGAILVTKQVYLLSPLKKRIHPFHLDKSILSNPDPATLIWIHSIFVLYKHVS